MEPKPISEQERSYFQEQAASIARILMEKYGGIPDIVSYSPDLTTDEWHVNGKEMMNDLVVAIPVGGQERVVSISTHYEGNGEGLKRGINVHFLDLTPEQLEQYRDNRTEGVQDLVASAIMDTRKRRKADSEITTHESAHLTAVGAGLKKGFSATAFATRQRFDHCQRLAEQALRIVQKGQERKLEYKSRTEKIMLRDK